MIEVHETSPNPAAHAVGTTSPRQGRLKPTASIHFCTYVHFIYIYIHTYMYIYIYIYTYVDIYVYIYIYVYILVIYMRTHTLS